MSTMKKKTELQKIQDSLLALSGVRKRLWQVVDGRPPFENADIKDKLKALIGLTNIELEALEDARRAELYLLLCNRVPLKEAVDAISEKYGISRKQLYDDWQRRDTWGKNIGQEKEDRQGKAD
jgi:hypothetical protein